MANATPPRPFWRRALNRIAILSGTALTGALAVGLVTVGSAYIAANAARVEPQAIPAPLPVATLPLKLQASYTVPTRFTGQIEPARSTDLAFEAGGTVAEILVDEGDYVDAGDIIARLDTRAIDAAEKAIANPLLDEVSLKGARGVLINITGGYDLTLFEMDEAANRIKDEVDPNAMIKFGSAIDPDLEGKMRVSVVATGIDAEWVSGANDGFYFTSDRMLVEHDNEYREDRAEEIAACGNADVADASGA